MDQETSRSMVVEERKTNEQREIGKCSRNVFWNLLNSANNYQSQLAQIIYGNMELGIFYQLIHDTPNTKEHLVHV